MIEALRKVIKRLHYPLEVMLTCVRWYVAYPLSLRHIEEMMQERGVFVDHATVHRWALKMLPVLGAAFRQRKRLVGKSWRVDETYIKVAGRWQYLYRAVDREGHTVDFLLTARRDAAASRRFLERAIAVHGEPEEITIDKSGANTAAVTGYKREKDDNPMTRGGDAQEGTHSVGLGLFIVREIAHAHRRTVAVASANGFTTFTVVLPRLAETVA
jgi:transposase-like protein